jgi:hypothetical protein
VLALSATLLLLVGSGITALAGDAAEHGPAGPVEQAAVDWGAEVARLRDAPCKGDTGSATLHAFVGADAFWTEALVSAVADQASRCAG